MASVRDTTRRARSVAWRRLADRSLRLLAAMPVGYGVASLWAMALARLLPVPAFPATVIATVVAFAICAAAAMWAYAARSGWRALWTLLALGGIAGAIVWASVAATGRL